MSSGSLSRAKKCHHFRGKMSALTILMGVREIKPKRGGTTMRVVASVSLHPELAERTRQAAGREGVSVSQLISHALEAYLREREREADQNVVNKQPRQ